MRPIEVNEIYQSVPEDIYIILASFEEMVREGEIDLLPYLVWLEDICHEKQA